MDKNFFSFDIDDEVLKQSEDNNTSKKVQISDDLLKKNDEKPLFCIKHTKKTSQTNQWFEKNKGLGEQKTINKNLCLVDDYLNFDFRAKQKSEALSKLNELELNLSVIQDKEVENVLERAHIGVIFY